MRRALARWRWAGLGVVWDAEKPDDTPLQVTAETTAAVHVHYHLHLAPGADPADAGLALELIHQAPQPRAVTATPITEGESE